VKINTFLMNPTLFRIGNINIRRSQENITGVEPTDIFGLISDDKEMVTVSMITWKRIEMLASLFSALEINENKLKEIFGG
jgi:hypothetical protein